MSHDTILSVLDEHLRAAQARAASYASVGNDELAAEHQGDAGEWARLYDAVHDGLLEGLAAWEQAPETPAPPAASNTPDGMSFAPSDTRPAQFLSVGGAEIHVYRISGGGGATKGFYVACFGCDNPGGGLNTFAVTRHLEAGASRDDAVQLALNEATALGRAHAAICNEPTKWGRETTA